MTREEKFNLEQELAEMCPKVCGCVEEFGSEGLYTIMRKFIEIALVDYEQQPNRLEVGLELCKGDWQFYYAIAVLCDTMELTEHGISIRGAWATEKGKRFVEIVKLLEEQEDAEAKIYT